MKLRNESSKYRLHVVLMFGKKTFYTNFYNRNLCKNTWAFKLKIHIQSETSVIIDNAGFVCQTYVALLKFKIPRGSVCLQFHIFGIEPQPI